MYYGLYLNNKLVASSYEMEDLEEIKKRHYPFAIIKVVHGCSGCGTFKDDVKMRYDYHGIPTRNYCDDCYENNYPYKKHNYLDEFGIADDGTPLESEY
jgi:hypothetical protein